MPGGSHAATWSKIGGIVGGCSDRGDTTARAAEPPVGRGGRDLARDHRVGAPGLVLVEFLLEIFVRAIALERWLSAQIKATDPGDPRFSQWLALQRAEAKVIASYATKLRLTPRSTWDRYTPKAVSRLPRPWEIGADQRPDDDTPDDGGSPFGGAA